MVAINSNENATIMKMDDYGAGGRHERCAACTVKGSGRIEAYIQTEGITQIVIPSVLLPYLGEQPDVLFVCYFAHKYKIFTNIQS